MSRFALAHATHPQAAVAAQLVVAQLRAQIEVRPGHPTLGLLYFTDHYAHVAGELLDQLAAELPQVTDWVGTVGVGVSATNVEYFDEPALAVMLCDLPASQYRVFSGVAPLPAGDRFRAQTALVHADAETPDVAELIDELAQRTASGYLFGGLAASRSQPVQIALSGHGHIQGQGAAGAVFRGGLSGVAFGPEVGLVSRVTQGARPIGPTRVVTRAEGNLVLELDHQPALAALLTDLQMPADKLGELLPRFRQCLVGLSEPEEPPPRRARGGARQHEPFGAEVRVRHLLGLDPARRALAIAELAPEGTRLAFCERHVHAARADLMRICAEIREELEPEDIALDAPALAGAAPGAAWQPEQRMLGAVYVSCAGRGGPHFGGPSAELQIVRRALGDVPLVGFFAGGEIAHHRLYGYTGVLTVFTTPA